MHSYSNTFKNNDASCENHQSNDIQLSVLEYEEVLSTVRRNIQNVTTTIIQGVCPYRTYKHNIYHQFLLCLKWQPSIKT